MTVNPASDLQEDVERDGYALIRAYLTGDGEAVEVVADNLASPVCTAAWFASHMARAIKEACREDGTDPLETLNVWQRQHEGD